MNTQIKNAMEKTLELAKKYGADQADVIVSAGESFSVSAQKGDIDKYKVSGARVLGIRSLKDERVGLSYTEAIDDDSLEIAVKKSLENAEASEKRPHEKIVVENSEGIRESEYKPDETSIDDKIKFALSLEEDVRKKESRVSSVPYNGLSESSSESYYMNSLNTFNYESEYYVSCYTSALIQDGANNSMHYASSIARSIKELDKNYCIEESLEHALQWLEAKSLPTKAYDVVFEVNAFASLFGCFGGIFSGKGAMDKVNPFADRLGQKIMSEEIVLWDRPNYEKAFFHSYFDSEGFEQKDLCLIENGELKTFYHNTATANYLNAESNARAARGAKSALGVSGTTKVFNPGKTAQADLTSGEYLEVLSMQGLHSGSDSYSGEFSFAASGYLCRDGKRVKPVKGVTVSGNFYQMMKNVKIIGDQVHTTHHNDFFAPSLRFEAMSVGGE